MKKVFTKLALRLGGYDKVRKLTLPQVQAMVNSMVDEQEFWVKLLGGEVKKEAPKEATEDDLNMLLGMFGG